MDFEEGLDAEQILAREAALAQRIAGVVAEPAQAPGGGESRSVEAHAEQAEELVGGERGGSDAGDAVEAFGLGGLRGEYGAVYGGVFGAHGGARAGEGAEGRCRQAGHGGLSLGGRHEGRPPAGRAAVWNGGSRPAA